MVATFVLNKIYSLKKTKIMICPRCNSTLNASVVNGIEIDNCPTCKGVWLDTGELEKMIEKSKSFHSDYSQQNTKSHDHFKSHDDHKYNDHNGNYHKKKKGNFLEDLFDF